MYESDTESGIYNTMFVLLKNRSPLPMFTDESGCVNQKRKVKNICGRVLKICKNRKAPIFVKERVRENVTNLKKKKYFSGIWTNNWLNIRFSFQNILPIA